MSNEAVFGGAADDPFGLIGSDAVIDPLGGTINAYQNSSTAADTDPDSFWADVVDFGSPPSEDASTSPAPQPPPPPIRPPESTDGPGDSDEELVDEESSKDADKEDDEEDEERVLGGESHLVADAANTDKYGHSNDASDNESHRGNDKEHEDNRKVFVVTSDVMPQIDSDIRKSPQSDYETTAFLEALPQRKAKSLRTATTDADDIRSGLEQSRDPKDALMPVEPEDCGRPQQLGEEALVAGRKSQLQVIIDPLPEHFHHQYEVASPSDYVATVVKRARGKNRFKIEFDDGRRTEVHSSLLADLPNGRKAFNNFNQKEAEDEDELSSYMRGIHKRKKTRRNADNWSDSSNMDVDVIDEGIFGGERLESPDRDDLMDLDIDDDGDRSDTNRYFQRRRLRSLAEMYQTISRQSSRLASTTTDGDTEGVTEGRRLRSRLAPAVSQQYQQSISHKPAGDEDIDELAADDDGDFIPTILSDLQPSHRPWKGRKRINGVSSNRYVREDSIEFEYRRSSRSTKNTRSMVEKAYLDDDSLSQEGERTPAVPKVINMKETFQVVDDCSPFKEAHCQTCDTCGGPALMPNKGVLIHCQGCSLSYHKHCIGIRSTRDHVATKVGPDSFVLQCRFCVGVYKAKDANCPDLSKCQVCSQVGLSCAPFSQKMTAKQEEKLRQENGGVDPVTPVSPSLVNNADNVLFRCTSCRRGFHFAHLPPPSAKWTDPDGANIRDERLAEYSIDWKCCTCREKPAKIDGLMAWRPAPGQVYHSGQMYADFEEDAKEYLVKWHEKSYAHCEWKPGAWVWGVTQATMRRAFAKKNGDLGIPPVFETKDAIPEEYLIADVILMVRYKHHAVSKSKEADLARINDIDKVKVKFQGLGYDAVVWDTPPPRDSGKRWRAFRAAYDEYLNGQHFKSDSHYQMRQRIKNYQSQKKFEVVKMQPAFLRRGKLMPYQIDGLNWLLLNFYKGKSVVLADEMGLGKTVQVIALLATLIMETPRCWPFLVVVPNSTCPNWRREIKNWAPDLRVVTYHGGKEAQSLAYDYELFPNRSQDMRAHIVIMSYDSAQDDHTRHKFKNVQWAGLVVDEGQRLKNDQNLLYLALRSMRISFRLLLTGTPLQNNKRELFNLLQFIDSSHKAAELDEKYQEITAENLPELHKLIRPYFLRRTKAEVLKFLPAMAQIIVPVTMTVLQEKLCKSIMAKNSHLIQAIFSKGRVKAAERGSLNNILMQLRKCLCHPFVYSEAIEDKNADPETMRRNLIEASSKLILLKTMLPKLKERGHRVLLFSQFLNQLDIIEDFLHIMDLPYQRLDGNISSQEKQKRIDEFNAPNSKLFAFLLSTRAGGVGINLATADTVIVLDPDFNPHQDIQAFSRAHRIGQKKKVLCFQLMTKDSAEEKIMQIGRKKMALDHALIESMDAEDDMSNDLESILKHGAEALFSGQSEENRIVYDSASVDRLLDRSQVENTRTDAERTAESQFSFARVWANETGTLADDIEVTEVTDSGEASHSVWESIIKEREEEAARLAEAEKEVLGRGGRRRNRVKYSVPRYDDGLDEGLDMPDMVSDDDRDGEFFGGNGDASSSSDEDDGHDHSPNDANGGNSMAKANSPGRQGRASQGTTPRKAATKKTAAKNPIPQKAKKVTPKKVTPKKATSPKKTLTPRKDTSPKTTPKRKATLKEVDAKKSPITLQNRLQQDKTSVGGKKTKAVTPADGEPPAKKVRKRAVAASPSADPSFSPPETPCKTNTLTDSNQQRQQTQEVREKQQIQQTTETGVTAEPEASSSAQKSLEEGKVPIYGKPAEECHKQVLHHHSNSLERFISHCNHRNSPQHVQSQDKDYYNPVKIHNSPKLPHTASSNAERTSCMINDISSKLCLTTSSSGCTNSTSNGSNCCNESNTSDSNKTGSSKILESVDMEKESTMQKSSSNKLSNSSKVSMKCNSESSTQEEMMPVSPAGSETVD